MSRFHVMVVYGTRPEAIKMAPLVLALKASDQITCSVVVTGQHREMLDQVNAVFGIEPDMDLDIFQPGQTLTDITTRTLKGVERACEVFRPDAVLVQGDTTTTCAAALGAFYARVPVIHTEAGLRTDDRWSPYPEEINRRLCTQLAELHLAPTEGSRQNLLRDGVAASDIVVTGNSVIDALHLTLQTSRPWTCPDLAATLERGRRVVLVTAHRRESWGEPMQAIGRALRRIALEHPDVDLVFPVHRNPVVRQAILPSISDLPNVCVTEPLPYGEFCQLMKRSHLVLTDSGGVQEEAPSLGRPVLVMRESTERPEAISAGTARLVGSDEETIVCAVRELLDDSLAYLAMANAVNPYGDGRAAERHVDAILHHFGRSTEPARPFTAAAPALLPEPVVDLSVLDATSVTTAS